MKFLIDSHVLIWAVEEPKRLSVTAAMTIQNAAHDRIVSAATIWEISIKSSLGKLTLSLPYKQWMDKAIADLYLSILPITVEYSDAQSRLPHHHGDPFDRLIIAQSLTDSFPIISADSQLDAYGIIRAW